MQPIYWLDGRYFGYLRNGQFLYRHDGVYIGWLTRGLVFRADGLYLGTLQPPSHIVRLTGAPVPPRQMVKPIPPAGRLAPVRQPDGVAVPPRAGIADALSLL